MRLPGFTSLCSLVVVLLAWGMAAQDLSSQPKRGSKLCVAMVANASTTSAFVERLTERLAKSLQQNKIDAVNMESRTTEDYPLKLTKTNGEEARQKDCDYVLVSQIRDPQGLPFDPRSPEISIGGQVPSIDASDPMHGPSGPVHRDNLQIAFALFRLGRLKAVLETALAERPSANVSDSFLPAMDREANRVGHELKKH